MMIELPAGAEWFALACQKDGRLLQETVGYFAVGTASTARGAVDALTSTLCGRARVASQNAERAAQELIRDSEFFDAAGQALFAALKVAK